MINNMWDLIDIKHPVKRRTKIDSKIYVYEDAYDILVEKNPVVKRLRDKFDCEIC